VTEQQKRNLAAACLVAGILATGVGVWVASRGWSTSRWAETTGAVVASRLTPVADGPDRADVVYRYAVDGKQYENNRIAYGRLTTEAGARAFVAAHPEGTTVMVFYDPDDPASAALERSGLATGSGALMVGLVLIICSRRLTLRSAA
jgi:hypothetical protein